MEDFCCAPESALLPPDFATWPKPARRLLRVLVSLPTWQTHAFAFCTEATIATWFDASDRSVRRWLKVATERGELARQVVRRGAVLPDGARARRTLAILVAGHAQRARIEAAAHAAVVDGGAQDEGGQDVRGYRPDRPQQPDKLTARSIDRSDPKEIDRAHEAQRSKRQVMTSLRSTSSSLSNNETPGDPGDLRVTNAVAHHYARVTGKNWRFIHPDVTTLILRFVSGMSGSEADKTHRACDVVDRVVTQQREQGRPAPTPRYVFHEQLFWRHLEHVSGHTPTACTKASPRTEHVRVKVSPPASVATAPKQHAPASPQVSPPPPVDFATVAAFVEALGCVAPERSSNEGRRDRSSVPTDVAPEWLAQYEARRREAVERARSWSPPEHAPTVTGVRAA